MDEKRINEGDSFQGKDGSKAPPLEQVLGDAEQALRKSISTLTEWTNQARNVFETRPGVVLASITIAGFMAGLLIRQEKMGLLRPHRRKTDFAADPLIVFVTGTLAGLFFGPRIIEEVRGFTPPGPEQKPPLGEFGHH